MRNLAAVALNAALTLAVCGCATIQTWSAEEGAPRYFSGTRLNLATLAGNQNELDEFRHYGANPLQEPYPLLDVPTSLVADLAMLPVALCETINEAIFHDGCDFH